ncbi:sensor histidine kinase [Kribbella monticola]|uniref:sensor histidine kinase n=1 Tax=Kribbella monticola TaxID=2185285 RepID=UPI000DD36B43|nr:sensor histidine kinase [Kribbella monticola]
MNEAIAPVRRGHGARLMAAISRRVVRDAFTLDVLLAIAGLAVTQVRIIQSQHGWPYAPIALQVIVAVAPALIAIRRVDPVLASAGLALGAYTSLLLGETDWVLLIGCTLALWSLAGRCRAVPTVGVTAVVAIAPLLASSSIGILAWDLYPEIFQEFTSPDGSHGSTGRTPSAVYDQIANMSWPWWVSAALAFAGLAGLAALHRWNRPRVLATTGERFDDVRRVLGEPDHAIAVDLLLATAMASLLLMDIWHGKSLGNWWTAPHWMQYAIGFAPFTLVLRRLCPEVPVVVMAAAGLLTYWQTEERWTLLIALAIALYTLAVLRPLPVALPVAVVALAAPPIVAATAGFGLISTLFPVVRNRWFPSEGLETNWDYQELVGRQWPVTLSAILLLPVCLGVVGRLYQRTRVARLREVELEEQNRQREETQILLEGRSEIARDLHDVVAHHVNLMVIQAETGPDLAQRDLDEVLAGFQRIGDAGRRALGELDRMLSALRDAEGRPDPALAPQPGLDEIAELANGLLEQGLPVAFELRGGAAGIPDGIQLTAYRLVQEALTNVIKHAGASAVEVIVEITSGNGVRVCVTDDGTGFDPDGDRSGRHGLTGMYERVRVHNGTLTISSTPGCGTKLSAWLPVSEVSVGR